MKAGGPIGEQKKLEKGPFRAPRYVELGREEGGHMYSQKGSLAFLEPFPQLSNLPAAEMAILPNPPLVAIAAR